MLTFFAALCQKWANPPSLKLSVSAIIDDAETVSADLRRAQSFEYTVSMLTFFAAFVQESVNPSSLKLFVSGIIDDADTVSTDLHEANVGDMKKINNHINPLNIQ